MEEKKNAGLGVALTTAPLTTPVAVAPSFLRSDQGATIANAPSHEPRQNAYGSSHGPSKRRTMRDYVKQQYQKPKRITVNCPVCKGSGKLPHPKLGKRRDETAGVALSVMAKSLREQGFSLREIGGFLGYPSPRSVQMLLKKHGMR